MADGNLYGKTNTMKTTIDHAGRLVIPKDIRRESGIKPGMPLEVRWEKGAIAITPAPLEVKLKRKGRLLVAVPINDTSHLSADTVEHTCRDATSSNAIWAPEFPTPTTSTDPEGRSNGLRYSLEWI